MSVCVIYKSLLTTPGPVNNAGEVPGCFCPHISFNTFRLRITQPLLLGQSYSKGLFLQITVIACAIIHSTEQNLQPALVLESENPVLGDDQDILCMDLFIYIEVVIYNITVYLLYDIDMI